jgi:cysteine desulfurase
VKSIYLDYAAATPISDEVAKAMAPFAADLFHNPSAVYLAAIKIKQAITAARRDSAKVLGVKPGEVTFTGGSTESINLVIAGIARRYPKGRIAVSAGEHAAVLKAAEGHAPGRIDLVSINRQGLVEPAALRAAIKPSTVLVSIAYANSESGAVQPIAKLTREARAAGNKLYFHTDASAAGYLPLKVNRLGVDLLSLGGGKIYGPKTGGLLFIKAGLKLEPLIYGGGQEGGRRAGTEDAGSIVGLATALGLIQTNAPKEARQLQLLRDQLEQELLTIKGIEPLSTSSKRLPHIVNLLMPVNDGERLVMELDEVGLQAATGAACSANTDQPSHVLLAMGLSPADANRSLRLSLGRGLTKAEIHEAAQRIATVLQK